MHAMKNTSVLRDERGVTIGVVETLADITALLEKESQIEAFRHDLQAENTFYGMIGTSTVMHRTFDLLANVAASDAPAFICGESGTGKELAASVPPATGFNPGDHPTSHPDPHRRIKKQELLQALTQAKGNKSLAAKILGVTQATVWHRMHRYGLLLRD